MRRITYLVLFFLIFMNIGLMGSTGTVKGQEGLTPIYSGANLSNFYWSPDSSMLIFQEEGYEAGVELENADFLYFDISSQALARSNIWPLQPSLSAQEQQAYRPYVYPTESIKYANENHYMFLSPNQRYMVYVAEPEDGVLAIADRQMVEANIFDVLSGNTIETRFFFALWSANSESVVIGNHPVLGDFPSYFYISDFASDIQNATIEELPGTVGLAEDEYITGRVRDINSDGSLLLTSSTTIESVDRSEPDTRLALFNPSDMSIQEFFENARVREQNIIVAAFDPNDERYVLALTQEGIQRYNTLANTWEMINADINATWVDYAQFSPDGRYIVVEDITDNNSSLSNVYVIDVM